MNLRNSESAELDATEAEDERRDFADVDILLGEDEVVASDDEFLGMLQNQYGDAAQLRGDITND